MPAAFRLSNNLWVNQNINLLTQVGDHEFTNDVGWDKKSLKFPGWVWTSPGVANGALSAYQKCLGELNPPRPGSQDTTANHWAVTMGDLTIVCPDNITTSEAEVNEDYTHPPANTAQVIMQDTQVEDLLDGLDTSAPFKWIPMANGIQYLTTNIQLESGNGVQHPIKNHSTDIYSKFVTSSTDNMGKKSIMSNTNTNGTDGITFFTNGDNHTGSVFRNAAPAYTNNLAEDFYSFSASVINGKPSFPWPASVSLAVETDLGTTVEYTEALDSTTPLNVNWLLQVEVKGTMSPKECHVSLVRINDATDEVKITWSGKFVAGEGNSPSAITGKTNFRIGRNFT
jgi:hypothetical protein